MVRWKSDQPIVLGGRESRPQGEGADRETQSAKETWSGRKTRESMPTSLRAIANKAGRDGKHRFRNLSMLLNRENLVDSWKYVKRRAASGVDRQSAREYERKLMKNLTDLVARLKGKRYRARLVRRVYIPKGQGKLRPLGIPVVEDKLVQLAVSRILSAIYENDFLPCSFGYRPNVGARDAVRELSRALRFGRFNYIVEADIKGFFDNISHDWLVRMLEQRVDDKSLIRLIRKWLNAGVLDTDGKVLHPVTGTPQGGVISPVLANVYLHYVLDLWFEKRVKPHCRGDARLCRYADDFVCMFQYKEDAEWFYGELPTRLAKFELEVAPEKTKLLHFSQFGGKESFDFLGFEFRWGLSRAKRPTIKRRMAPKKFRSSLKNFNEWIREHRHMKPRDLVSAVNGKLRGHYNYYGVLGNSKGIVDYAYHVRRMLYRWMNRRSQRRSYNWTAFAQMLKRYPLLPPRITEGRTTQPFLFRL